MVKLTREIVHELRDNQRMTFADIGRMFGVKRQRAWNLYTGYEAVYRKTEKYKMYKRHIKHTTPYKPCSLCESMPTPSMSSTNLDL